MLQGPKLSLHPELQNLPNVGLLTECIGMYSFNVVNVTHLTALDIIGELFTGGIYTNVYAITPICDAPPVDKFMKQYLNLLRNGFILVGEVGDGIYDNYFYDGHLGFKDSDLDYMSSIYARSSISPKLFRRISLLKTFSHLSIFNCPNLERLMSQLPDSSFSIKFNDGSRDRRLIRLNKGKFILFLPFLSNPTNEITVTNLSNNETYKMDLSLTTISSVVKELISLSEVIHTIVPSVVNGIQSSFSKLDLNSIKEIWK